MSCFFEYSEGGGGGAGWEAARNPQVEFDRLAWLKRAGLNRGNFKETSQSWNGLESSVCEHKVNKSVEVNLVFSPQICQIT